MIESRLIRILRWVEKPLTTREAYDYQFTIPNFRPMISLGIWAGNVNSHIKRRVPKVARRKNSRGRWEYYLLEWDNYRVH